MKEGRRKKKVERRSTEESSTCVNHTPLLPHPHLQFPYESLFRSLHFALMDNCCREYLFVVEFFNLPPAAGQDFFDKIWEKTLAHILVREM